MIMKERLLQIFQDGSNQMSSKRVFGSIGFICGIVMAFLGKDLSTISLIVGVSAGMVGMDSITDIWKGKL